MAIRGTHTGVFQKPPVFWNGATYKVVPNVSKGSGTLSLIITNF